MTPESLKLLVSLLCTYPGLLAILVKLDNDEDQKQLLAKARHLRNKVGFSEVYIKKDLHYTVRKELSRLKKRELQEKSDPKNSKNNIRLDLKDRVLRINGLTL